MIAIACVVLALNGIFLMASLGVGPFAQAPWEKYYFKLQALKGTPLTTLQWISAVISFISALIIIGIIPTNQFG